LRGEGGKEGGGGRGGEGRETEVRREVLEGIKK
jgi:hypothetical protein